jgi:hypothetical protein
LYKLLLSNEKETKESDSDSDFDPEDLKLLRFHERQTFLFHNLLKEKEIDSLMISIENQIIFEEFVDLNSMEKITIRFLGFVDFHLDRYDFIMNQSEIIDHILMTLLHASKNIWLQRKVKERKKITSSTAVCTRMDLLFQNLIKEWNTLYQEPHINQLIISFPLFFREWLNWHRIASKRSIVIQLVKRMFSFSAFYLLTPEILSAIQKESSSASPCEFFFDLIFWNWIEKSSFGKTTILSFFQQEDKLHYLQKRNPLVQKIYQISRLEEEPDPIIIPTYERAKKMKMKWPSLFLPNSFWLMESFFKTLIPIYMYSSVFKIEKNEQEEKEKENEKESPCLFLIRLKIFYESILHFHLVNVKNHPLTDFLRNGFIHLILYFIDHDYGNEALFEQHQERTNQWTRIIQNATTAEEETKEENEEEQKERIIIVRKNMCSRISEDDEDQVQNQSYERIDPGKTIIPIDQTFM